MSSAGLQAVGKPHVGRAGHYGPSAFGEDLRRFVNLTVMLAATDFKLRYFGSVLGYLWSLVKPLLYFGVLYVVFTVILHVGEGVPHYAVYLLTAIMLWNFFLETTNGAVPCLVAREGLLRKIRFPRLAIPLAVSLTAPWAATAAVVAAATAARPNRRAIRHLPSFNVHAHGTAP